MIVVHSFSSVPIRLAPERWQHILTRHPELQGQKEKVLEMIASPDFVQTGDFGTLMAAKHFAKTPLTDKLLVVIYRELGSADGFVITAYFTNELSKRRQIIWRR